MSAWCECKFMSKKDKLKNKLLSNPSDFTWNQLKTLMQGYGFTILEGKGSRVKFYHEGKNLYLAFHKPHPGNVIKQYMVDDTVTCLKNGGFLKNEKK